MDHINRRLEIIGLALLAFIICALGIAWIDGFHALERLVPVFAIGVAVVSLLGWRLGSNESRPIESRQIEPKSIATQQAARSGLTAGSKPDSGAGAAETADSPVASSTNAGSTNAGSTDPGSTDTATDTAGPVAPSELGREHAYVRALHDEVSEHVSAIRSMGQAITRRATDPAMKEASSLVLESADHLDTAIRRVLIRHTGSNVAVTGLSDMVSELVGQTQDDIAFRNGQRKIVLRLSPEVDAMPAAVADAGIGIVRQALDNAVAHSGAGQIEVNLRVLEGHLVLQVSDNGVGMPETLPSRRGLDAMADRAVAVGGVFELGKSRLGGVIARARLPVSGSSATPAAAA